MTNETKHTPGPWKATDRYVITEKQNICHMTVMKCLPTEETEANARLIAAAPELLAALEGLMSMRDKCFIPNENNEWDDMAEAAIAKARSQS